jgi:hypothetical protein
MTPNTQTKPDLKEMVASVEEAATRTEEAAAKFTMPISNEDKTTILLNVESAIKDLAAALAKKNEIKGADIDPSAYEHLPNSLTGVMVHYFVKGLKEEFDIAFEEAPTALKVRSSNPMDKKVAGKKRLLTRDQKNELLAKTQMAFYEYKIRKGEMTIEQAMYAVKDAYERKQNFEEMGYMLPIKKTEYPYWADDAS